ncbi:MAG: AAA family ATPase [Candidatus Eremiobacteraeota bacterium]|nr:AAA family ATPase [Candidatus Eremiobacteraeota bacterium]
MQIQSNNAANFQAKTLSARPGASAEQPASDSVQLGSFSDANAPQKQNSINKFLVMGGVAAAATVAAVALPSMAHAADGAAATAVASTGAATASSIIGTLVPLAGLGLMGFMAYRMIKQGGGGGIGGGDSDKGAGKVVKSDKTFADVAGIPEAKEELQFTVDFMKNPGKYAKLGAKVPRGVLLSGPPGCGKTLLAKATAGEAGVNFIQATGSDFVEKYVGVGAKRVRDLFDEAKKNMPCIIFIDEIDAVGAQRTGGGEGGNRETEQTLNALLTQMDGFNSADGIIVMAATNRPEMLDSALVRSGRFDSKVTVNPPNREGRRAILDVHGKNKPIDDVKSLDLVADRTTGMVGADLENIMNKAATQAAREGADKITLKHLSEAIDTVAMGPQAKSRKLDEFEKKVTGYHEAGHAIISKALPSNGTLMKVSILPRGQAAGVCWTNPVDNKSMYSRQELEDHICMLLGGAAAEELKIGKNFTGPSNDIERATQSAMGMVMEYGMTPGYAGNNNGIADLGKVKYVDVRSRGKGLAPSAETQREIDKAVKGIIDQQWARAKTLLQKNDAQFTNLAETLIKKEEIDRPELEQILTNIVDK